MRTREEVVSSANRTMRLKNLEPAYMDSDSVDEILSLDQSGGEKNFKCIFEGCQAAFGRQNRLIQHVRVHTGEVSSF